MSYKKKLIRQVSSSDSESDSNSSSGVSSEDVQTSLSSSSSQQKQMKKKLSKRDLKKLIKLQKQIQQQKKLLKKLKSKKIQNKPTTKKQTKKDQLTQLSQLEMKINRKTQNYSLIPESKKLFITGIQTKYSHQQVSNELKKAIQNLKGVIGFRIKRKQGCPTYAFLDCQTKELARQVMEKLRRIKIFGVKLPVYYSQDEKKQPGKAQDPRKKCFQCNCYGHFAKDCYNRNRQQYEDSKKQSEKKSEQKGDNSPETKTTNIKLEYIQPNTEEQQQKKAPRRVVRDKSRLNRLANFN